MKSGLAFALFVLAFIATLIVTAPATLLAPIVRELSDGRAALANCQGTVWRGRATPLLQPNGNEILALPAIQWQVEFAALSKGGIQASFRWVDMPDAPPMEISWQGKRLVMEHVLLLLPARVIGEVSNFLKPAQFNGMLRMQSDRLELSGNRLDGRASIHWTQAGSALSSINPLGDYRIDLDSRQNRVDIALSTLSGALAIEGKGNWSAEQGIRFEGYAGSSGDQQERLSELLYHLGPEIAPGKHAISIAAAR